MSSLHIMLNVYWTTRFSSLILFITIAFNLFHLSLSTKWKYKNRTSISIIVVLLLLLSKISCLNHKFHNRLFKSHAHENQFELHHIGFKSECIISFNFEWIFEGSEEENFLINNSTHTNEHKTTTLHMRDFFHTPYTSSSFKYKLY